MPLPPRNQNMFHLFNWDATFFTCSWTNYQMLTTISKPNQSPTLRITQKNFQVQLQQVPTCSHYKWKHAVTTSDQTQLPQQVTRFSHHKKDQIKHQNKWPDAFTQSYYRQSQQMTSCIYQKWPDAVTTTCDQCIRYRWPDGFTSTKTSDQMQWPP